MEERNIDLQRGTRFDRDRVRRGLFANDDDDNNKQNNTANYFSPEEEMRKEREEMKEKYNFDFEKEEPLPGRYEWERVSEDGTNISVQSNNQIQNSQNPQEDNAKEIQNNTEEINKARIAN